MNARNTVWVERIDSRIVRIFRSTHGQDWDNARVSGTLETCPKKDAVGAIRSAIWKRCGGRCEWCGTPVTEAGPLWKRGHMHEQVAKGNGGEVSLDNSVMICYDCHFGDNGHGNRRPQFTKSFEEVMEG
jgi:5-methylcytosine-specific restriction endonuclease McrA